MPLLCQKDLVWGFPGTRTSTPAPRKCPAGAQNREPSFTNTGTPNGCHHYPDTCTCPALTRTHGTCPQEAPEIRASHRTQLDKAPGKGGIKAPAKLCATGKIQAKEDPSHTCSLGINASTQYSRGILCLDPSTCWIPPIPEIPASQGTASCG